jgi:hypothetical protein
VSPTVNAFTMMSASRNRLQDERACGSGTAVDRRSKAGPGESDRGGWKTTGTAEPDNKKARQPCNEGFPGWRFLGWLGAWLMSKAAPIIGIYCNLSREKTANGASFGPWLGPQSEKGCD